MVSKRWLVGAIVAASLVVSCSDGNSPPATAPAASRAPAAAASPRIYVLENGTISGLDAALFNFKAEELKHLDFVNTAYLIVHPRGTLMFDSGAVPDSHFKGDGSPVVEGVITATKPVLPQLKAAGYEPGDITYFADRKEHTSELQ